MIALLHNPAAWMTGAAAGLTLVAIAIVVDRDARRGLVAVAEHVGTDAAIAVCGLVNVVMSVLGL